LDKKPTIDDVARAAGVARATVSRVLNFSPNTSERVRERVLQAVKDLGYQVNLQARQLASGSSRLVALIFAADADAEPNSYYHSAVELGAMRACSELGYSLIAHTLDPAKNVHRSRVLAMVDERRCDGLVLTPPFSDDAGLIRALKQRDAPFVLISAGPDARRLAHSVGIDDRQAGFELGEHLVRRGHRCFGFISGPQDHRSAALRLDGFLEALNHAGVDESCVTVAKGNFTFKSGIDCAEKLLASVERPTALACANDLSITGFDDTPVSQIVWPPLTTIHQPLRVIGSKAVELLVGQIMRENGASDAADHQHLVPFQLIQRSSTGQGAPN
jgi:LacI family transcriptional regulator